MSSYNYEKEFLDEVEQCLKNNNCQTWREVTPDEYKNSKYPIKVDLIFYRKDFGFIGVEAKNMNTLRSGGVIAKAVNQIENKYKKQTYFGGNKIHIWAVTFPLKSIYKSYSASIDEEDKGEFINEILHFIGNFLNTLKEIHLLQFCPEKKIKKPSVKIGRTINSNIVIGGEPK